MARYSEMYHLRRMHPLRWLLKLSLFAFFLYLVHLIRDQYLFERFLNSSFLSFDDFSPSYTKALKESVSNHTELEFDYSLFSENNTSSSYSPKIPRIIHFIWFKDIYESHDGTSDIPSSGSDSPDVCRRYNPDFEINIWNTTAAQIFFETEYAWFLPTYHSYAHPIQRVDALKYFLLWHYGGVYMDLDITCRRALDPLLTVPAWFPRAQPLGVNCDLMATAARHPIIGKMTESLRSRNRWLVFPYLTIFWSTGPQFASDMLRTWFKEEMFGGRVGRNSSKINAGNQEFFVLPLMFYSEEYSFFGHHPGGTWHGQDVAVVLWLVERRWTILILGCMLLCVLVVKAKRRSIFNLLSRISKASLGETSRAIPSLPLFTIASRPQAKRKLECEIL